MRYEDSLTYTHWWLWYTTWTKWKHSIHDYLFKEKESLWKNSAIINDKSTQDKYTKKLPWLNKEQIWKFHI